MLFHLIKLMFLAMIVVGFFIKNNIEHVLRQREVLKTYPKEIGIWFELYKGLKKQSLIAIFTALPYWLMDIIPMVLKYIAKTEDDSKNIGFIKSVNYTFIDAKGKIDDFEELRNQLEIFMKSEEKRNDE